VILSGIVFQFVCVKEAASLLSFASDQKESPRNLPEQRPSQTERALPVQVTFAVFSGRGGGNLTKKKWPTPARPEPPSSETSSKTSGTA